MNLAHERKVGQCNGRETKSKHSSRNVFGIRLYFNMFLGEFLAKYLKSENISHIIVQLLCIRLFSNGLSCI